MLANLMKFSVKNSEFLAEFQSDARVSLIDTANLKTSQ